MHGTFAGKVTAGRQDVTPVALQQRAESPPSALPPNIYTYGGVESGS